MTMSSPDAAGRPPRGCPLQVRPAAVIDLVAAPVSEGNPLSRIDLMYRRLKRHL